MRARTPRAESVVAGATALLASLLVATACSATVEGSGSRASRPPTAAPTGPIVPSSTPTSTPTPSSATPSATGSPVRGLDCRGGTVITAPRAPFCYPLPPGFTDFSTLSNYGKGWTFKTLVSVGRNDLIEVFASRYPDTSSLSDAALKARFEKFGRLRVGRYDIVRAGKVTTTRIAGGRAFRQSGTYRSGVATEYTTIFYGRVVANIQCQSLRHTAQVRDACATVRATLQLVSP